MQKYLLYRKGLRMADIDQDDVKSGAQRALSDWIARERFLLEETGERAAFTFRFVEMRGYKAGYEGSCYWVSFGAHRPYAKKEGHHPNRARFDAWVYWDQDRWNVLPFKKATLDDDFLFLMESWKKEEQPHLIPPLKGMDGEEGTTTDDIYVDVLQRLQAAQVRLGASITYQEAEHIEEDEEYHEIYVPAGEVQVWFMIEDEIKLYEEDRIVLPHSGFVIDDLEEIVFEVEEHHPPPLDWSLSFEERLAQTTDMKTFCSLINELADMGCEVSVKREEKDGAPQVRVLDVEYINNKDGLDGLASFLSRGKYRIHYLPFPEDGEEEGPLKPDEVQTTELPTYMSFWAWFDRGAVCYRVDYGDEDALTYYRTTFLPKVRAARANGEIPSLLF
jgi:hypothetical protein